MSNDASSSPRILLIEDEMLVAGMLQSMLSSLGYAAIGPATDVHEVMEILSHENVDAVVLDINLNGQMSYPIADELAMRGIPFIFSTGYEPQRLPAKHEGRPLLKKPFRRSALGAALKGLLEQDERRPDFPALATQDRAEAVGRHMIGSSLPRLVVG
jgi:DNA-binding response OmpR family regulator